LIFKNIKIKYNNNNMDRVMQNEIFTNEVKMLHQVINDYKSQQLQDEKTINELKKKITDLKQINNMIIEHVYPETIS
tara:strand:- start:244 stop:474 length:231 start_codon:yes stop_codon:yes gene_type:complete